ncbi:cyclopropane-fatty-acyl-phospholipid synthase family protein [Candidatus Pseudothioglobus sp. Uisw_041]|jgi:cyclopropane-fatty-acyl-phospholipid synthase|uniref:class I SAM-dependent methyltransferase n=1 Tax=Candidatus Pseudothioglobus sp. Uisw_041 TaxID=3230996 RepID=UPI00233A4A49|nr:cyclopropane-fatty-acyl-phospholipid synthase family protein [Candidatus Thioglobus sp.]MDC1387312.1 cyclopropane-fatty-acyl-phospholipid synthase family protein [Candidatus Thioglobus sp.]MDC1418783.1 cyclopropane-fatty-acyl-phospholipid synthase family protein [Candidatus Thioglobus sp.]MDC3360884.1 cyclopropane-fatty-acyl-phospholipid synthase family protein [Candidatus Thioglobus sp.]|tara:strand:- start:2023 stop:3312 length:1290 start_codon:yes stop_codon:yes gene_type:complete
MTQEIQTKDRLSVDGLANNIQEMQRSTRMTSFFKRILFKKLKGLKTGELTIIDGSEIHVFGIPKSELKATLTVSSQEFYVFLGSGGTNGAAEAFTAGYWSADNLVELIQIIIRNKKTMEGLESGLARLTNPITKIIHRLRQNTLKGSKSNILAHYDLSNDFYKLWLDSTMTYSSGIFLNKKSSMLDASVEKLDRLCRKLNLNSSDHVLEIGTGWGSFATHAAKNYGCKVTTTTISDNQFNYVAELISKENLDNKITLLNKDYRELEGVFDKVVSIEMIEAVGSDFVPGFFEKASSLLKKNGLMALQGITYNDPDFNAYKNSVDFIRKYIFPGSCLISLSQVEKAIKDKTDLIMVDSEDITLHYARTLEIWRKDFENVLPQVRELGFSDPFIRIWVFYLVYCEAGFLENLIGDFQFIFAKPDSKNIKITH